MARKGSATTRGEALLLVGGTNTELDEVSNALCDAGYCVERAISRNQADDMFRAQRHGLVLVDLAMPGDSAHRTIESLLANDRQLPVVVLGTREQTADVAIAIEHGAFDWIARPVDTAKLVTLVNALLARRGLLVKPLPLEGGIREEPGLMKIVGSSDKIRDVFRSIGIVTASDVPVLIQGETGTGKELVARAIHYRGPRRKSPFYPVNCAAIPEPLLESELFGHERGAFTGAVERRLGKFEVADGGTLFLDEIAEMPPSTQAKILRVIEEHSFQRIGGNDAISVNVRIISATNKDLAEAVQRGAFRDDLFYRLSVFPIILPPLRERRNDITELADYFLNRVAEETNKKVTKFTRAAADALLAHDWPGNVRELQNTIQRAALLASSDTLEREHLGLLKPGLSSDAAQLDTEIQAIVNALTSGQVIHLERVEKVFIRQAITATNGNITEAANRLGISRSTIYRKLQEMQETSGN